MSRAEFRQEASRQVSTKPCRAPKPATPDDCWAGSGTLTALVATSPIMGIAAGPITAYASLGIADGARPQRVGSRSRKPRPNGGGPDADAWPSRSPMGRPRPAPPCAPVPGAGRRVWLHSRERAYRGFDLARVRTPELRTKCRRCHTGLQSGAPLKKPVAISKAWPARRTRASACGRPAICSDSGNPSFEKPHSRASAGPPVQLNGDVKFGRCQKASGSCASSCGAGEPFAVTKRSSVDKAAASPRSWRGARGLRARNPRR